MPDMTRNPLSRTFFGLWLGQTVSLLGSQLCGFALGVTVFARTGSALLYGLVLFVTITPQALVAPFAGVVVDRVDRRIVLLFEQVTGALCALVMLLLAFGDRLNLGWILLLVGVQACCAASNFQAFAAATTLLVPKERLARANGLVQLGVALAQIIAPAIAGAILSSFGLLLILLVDLCTFVFASCMLLIVRIPKAPVSDAGRAARGSVREELRFGWRFIRERPGLFWLLIFFAGFNLTIGVVRTLIGPLVLGFADSRALGFVLSSGGLGMLLGSGVMLTWGGPKRQVYGIMIFALMLGILLFLGAARPSTPLIALGAFGGFFTAPLISGCSDTIWQRKVPSDVQGRVFSFRALVAGGTLPLASLIAGPLSDHLFEPLLQEGGALAGSVGRLLGVGPGRGVALLFVVLGAATSALAAAAYLHPRLRQLEVELPDVNL